jgi:8-oxo-dGTP pyrophosphatase MutT (NUDIX family)
MVHQSKKDRQYRSFYFLGSPPNVCEAFRLDFLAISSYNKEPMRVDFALPRDGEVHRICLACHADGVLRIKEDKRIRYACPTCGLEDDKSLYWGAGKEWIAEDGELWHDTAAVVVRDRAGRVLLYERTEYPIGHFTVPAGHIDIGETPKAAAARELEEEAGLQARDLKHAITLDFTDASCSAGSDAHRWHVYVETVDNLPTVHITDEEGYRPMWLTPEEAMNLQLLPPVRRLLSMLDLSVERQPIATLEATECLAG